MNKTRKTLLYLALDLAISFVVWLVFFTLRREAFEDYQGYFADKKFYEQIRPALVIGIYWVIIYALAGLYSDPYRRSRFREFTQILKFTLGGVLLIFFLIFFDDERPFFDNNNQPTRTIQFYLIYFGLQFFTISIAHFLITSWTNSRIRNRKIGFKTAIIGNGKRAFEIWEELKNSRKSLGFDVQGYISTNNSEDSVFFGKLKNYGELERVEEIINTRKLEEVIIALEKEDREQVMAIVNEIEGTGARIKIVPGVYDYVIGGVRVTNMLGSPLIEIHPRIMSPLEAVIKRSMDIVVSFLVLILLSPLYLLLALAVRIDSKGPIFYKQERIGKRGKPFKIIKYRTMVTDAEQDGPALSSENDPRITKVGSFLRKTRLDEFPQFWNVLKGEMSLVGPRPERQFFIDQIIQKAPYYKHLHKVKPGITSWGQVKYGYAENVEEMIERLKFDILYMENMSLGLDIKIMLYTVLIMIEGRGK